jgi:4-amino-4-deoxy-L-arabinose transferase-like glycosyltransferase
MLLGSSEVILRIPSVIFGLITICIVFLIAEKLFNRRVGLIASSLMATSGLAIYYSQEARMYGLAALLVSCLVYLFLREKWFYFSMVLVLVGATDYVSLFVIPIFIIVGWKDIKKLVLSFIPLTVSYLFWFPIFIKQLGSGLSVHGSAWWGLLGTSTLKNAVLIPVKFILGRISFDNKLLYGVVVAIVFFLFGFLLWKARKVSRILWLWLMLPIVLGVLVSLKIPSLSYFRFLFCLPAFYILIAEGIQNSGKYRNLFWGLVIGVNILTSGYYLVDSKFHREDWRRAASVVGEDKVVFPAATQKEALIYYGKGDQIINASQITPNDKVIWLSRYVWEIFDPGDLARKSVEALGYNKTSEYNFNGVVFWKCTK